MKHFENLSEMHRTNGFPLPENPMLSLVRCTQSCGIVESEFTTASYMIGFKKMKSGVMVYGRTKYDSQSGSMYFVKPQQKVELVDVELEEEGFAIFIHEDYFNGHPLHSEIKKYGFFDYETSEALHLTPREEALIWELYTKIETEYNNTQDEYSREIILTHIDSILKYSQRFYKRQFLNRMPLSGKTVSKFNALLDAHFDNDGLRENGLPTVQELASRLNVSTRYLTDLLKQETGKTAMELIHIHLISEAKNLLMGDSRNVTEIAYSLGFENPPYFSRLFKKETGMSPNQFKKIGLN